jgi:hypothetical protein
LNTVPAAPATISVIRQLVQSDITRRLSLVGVLKVSPSDPRRRPLGLQRRPARAASRKLGPYSPANEQTGHVSFLKGGSLGHSSISGVLGSRDLARLGIEPLQGCTNA